jgi:Phospholipase_D-nuclease N-terminal
MQVPHPKRMTRAPAAGEIVARNSSEPGGGNMAVLAPTLLGADYPFLDVMWTMFIFFAWVIFIYLLILVLADNFRRSDHSGLAKAGWTVFVIFLPLLGVLIYMIARPREDLLEA